MSSQPTKPPTKPKKPKKQTPPPARDDKGRLLPGHTANPNGRPTKEHSITETIKAMMGAKPEIKQALGTKIIAMALNGDIHAIKLVWSYMDGNPNQPIEHSGEIRAASITYVRPTDNVQPDDQAGSSLELPDRSGND